MMHPKIRLKLKPLEPPLLLSSPSVSVNSSDTEKRRLVQTTLVARSSKRLKPNVKRVKLTLKSVSQSSEEPSETRHKAEVAVVWAMTHSPILQQDYRIASILGFGGCGCVLKATRRTDNRSVAIKIIYKQNHLVIVNGVPLETDILRSVRHPNIVSYLGHFHDHKYYYLIMELFGTPWRLEESNFIQAPSQSIPVTSGSCATLFDFIDLYGRCPVYLQQTLFKQICLATEQLHELMVVHGDIKEENILIQIVNKQFVAKLCDFGHCRRTKRRLPYMKHYGTMDISAPELLGGDTLFSGFEQDIWALGIVLYTMIHGGLPPQREGSQVYLNTDYDPHISADVLVVLQKLLTIDYTKRPTIKQILS
ncbi:kinase-like domain-containing protein, partial [Gorgonomyces haynaldii]